MKKIIYTIIFFALMEYQVFVGQQQYALIPAIGLVLLCIYEFFTENKVISFKSGKEHEEKRHLSLGEKILAAIYGAVLVVSFIFQINSGAEFAFILLAGILCVTILSFQGVKNKDTSLTQNTYVSSFIIPKLLLYTLNYLLSVQIQQSFAYQSILLLSCFILYDIFAHSEKILAKLKTHQLTQNEFKHYLFHRWSKYWSFFLGIWYIIVLRSNGVINATYEYVMLFAFMVSFFTYLVRNQSSFTRRDFIITIVSAAIIAGFSPLVTLLFGNEIPTYLIALTSFIAFDIGDIYFHQREFQETSTQFWSQKMVVYLLIGIYITQLHFMMTNTAFTISQFGANIFH